MIFKIYFSVHEIVMCVNDKMSNYFWSKFTHNNKSCDRKTHNLKKIHPLSPCTIGSRVPCGAWISCSYNRTDPNTWCQCI